MSKNYVNTPTCVSTSQEKYKCSASKSCRLNNIEFHNNPSISYKIIRLHTYVRYTVKITSYLAQIQNKNERMSHTATLTLNAFHISAPEPKSYPLHTAQIRLMSGIFPTYGQTNQLLAHSYTRTAIWVANYPQSITVPLMYQSDEWLYFH
jgi:hypothetical protein